MTPARDLSPHAGITRRAWAIATGAALAAPVAMATEGRPVLQVGPGRAYTSIGAAARAAPDQALIEVDAGDYRADTAVWERPGLTVRGMGAGVRLIADGAHAQGKGLWVLNGGSLTVERIAFTGTRVPDRNGAGIRLQQGQLTVRHCRFEDNENGILTSNDPASSLVVEFCAFGHNGAGDGYTHNLYVGRIASLSVTGSHFHHARIGHLLKSRARRSQILYNRLTDEGDGRASYELEFPNGGDVLVLGNLVQQGERTENPTLVSCGAEGYEGPVQQLRLLHNTLVNSLPRGGALLRVHPGARQLALHNNLLVGPGDWPGEAGAQGNLRVEAAALADAARHDYRLKSPTAGLVARPLPAELQALQPTFDYQHPLALRPLGGPATLVGALQATAR